jgi:DNA-binding LacI/PurR family transcriptional regulator
VIDAPVSSNLALVARRIEGDIRARGLHSGDRYLSVADAAQMLGVSPATAHRAMDLLVGKRLLIRQHGRGTFIGDAAGRPRGAAAPRVRAVHILLPEEQEGVAPFPMAEPILQAVRRSISGVNVQFGFVPAFRAVEYVRELVGAAHDAGQLFGVIPISCPREVYSYLDALGAPMVVLGSLCPDQSHIASVDADYLQVGRLLAGYMLRRRHRRMALFVSGEGRPGDHAFLDGISEVLTEAELPHNTLTVRIFPRDFNAFRAQVKELLSRSDRPDGVICGTSRLVGEVVAVAESIGLAVPGQLDIAYYGEPTSIFEASLAHVEMTAPFNQVASMLAETLKRLAAGQVPEHRNVVIPVQLVAARGNGRPVPSGRANGS